MNTFGFIGTGNMGKAIATAMSKVVDTKTIYLSNRTKAKAESFAKDINANFSTNAEIAKNCKYIFLGVKPQMLNEVCEEIKPILKERTDEFYIITMAAGISIQSLLKILDGDYKTIRIMPNTPVSIGEGVILYSLTFAEDIPNELKTALSKTGFLDKIDEKLIDAASALSGCGPAFVYMFIESLADGAVLCGVPRDKALFYASQTLIGSAKMVIETKEHPESLKDKVCSPMGSTIAGVKALENGSFRNSAIDAVVKAYQRTLELGKNK